MEKTIIQPQNPALADVDKLLELCFEDTCSVELLLYHLNTSFSKTGIRDYIINQLFTSEEKALLFYVPQVVYLALLHSSRPLEMLIVHLASKSTEAFIMICWTFSAWSHDTIKRRVVKKPLDILVALLEERRLSTSTEIQQARAELWALLNSFTSNLTNFSLYLKTKPQEGRKERLKAFINVLNNMLRARRQKSLEESRNLHLQAFYAGIVIPFIFCQNASSNVVVAFLPDEISCFETKKRCPYKIVLECVDKDELKSKRENEKKVKLLNIKEEDENDIKDFQSQEFQINRKVSSDTVSPSEKFRGLDTFALKKEREENSLQAGSESNGHLNFSRKRFMGEENKFSLFTSPKINFPIYRHSIKDPSVRLKPSLETKKILASRREAKDRKTNSICFGELTAEKAQHRLRFLEELCENSTSKSFTLAKKIQEEKVQLNEYIISSSKDKEGSENKSIAEEAVAKKIFKELWQDRIKRIRSQSSFGHFDSYSLRPLIVKGGDDLRQEVIAMQLMKKFRNIFIEERTNCFLRPYEIIVISHSAGFLEFLTDTVPLDTVKKLYKTSLSEVFNRLYSEALETARKNFIESLAGYSLFSYFVQIKDRHNGNIMLSHEGHIIHIDFGFLFSTSPGNLSFENAPFKLTSEYLDLLQGKGSDFFLYYRSIMIKGILALQKHFHEIINIVRIMCNQSSLPCFEKFVLTEFEDRFKVYFSEAETTAYVDKLIDDSLGSNRTIWYDDFQKITNKIEP